jgi:hypothetical protein
MATHGGKKTGTVFRGSNRSCQVKGVFESWGVEKGGQGLDKGDLHCFFYKASDLKIKGYIAIMSGDLWIFFNWAWFFSPVTILLLWYI